MSDAPQVMVEVGETDCWDVAARVVRFDYPSTSALIQVDSRLRIAAVGVEASPAVVSVSGMKSISLSATPRYLEVVFSAAGGLNVGVIPSDASLSDYNPSSWYMSGAGTVVNNSTTLHSGAAPAAGDKIGIALYSESGVDKVQFYLNRLPFGAAQTITPNKKWKVFVGFFSNAERSALFLCDASELPWLPPGGQPWGAAARVADKTSCSPAATLLESVPATVTLDSFRKVATGSADAKTARAGGGTRTGDRLYYVEGLPEVAAANGGMLGLIPRTGSVDTWPGSGASDGYGIYRRPGGAFDGEIYFDGSTVADLGSFSASDVPGFVWNPARGLLWWTKSGVPFSGDPQAGTGAHHTGVFGDLLPVVAPYSGGRWRLGTHAREQIHLPSYAEGWDGADLLPDVEFEGTLLPQSAVDSAVSFPIGSARPPAETIGELVVANAGGEYDALADWDLHNQPVVGYCRIGDHFAREFTGVVDSVKRNGFAALAVRIADGTAPLDTRIDAPIVLFGTVARAPMVVRQQSELIYDVAPTALFSLDGVFDGGLEVSTWARVPTATSDPAADLGAIRRTDAPDSLQSVTELAAYFVDPFQPDGVAITNGDLNAWTGNTPNGWTKTEAGTATVTSSGGTAARFQSPGTAGNYAAIHQAGVAMSLDVFVALHITVNTSGDLVVAFEDFAGAYGLGLGSDSVHAVAKIKEGGTGWFWIPIPWPGAYEVLSIYTDIGTGAVDVTVNEVRAFDCNRITESNISLGEVFTTGSVVFATNPDNAGQLRCAGGGIGNAAYFSNQRPTLRQLLQVADASLLADRFTDAEGRVLRAFLTEPSAVLDTDVCYLGLLEESDIKSDIEDDDVVAERLSDIAWYDNNFAKHGERDVLPGVANSARAALMADAQERRLSAFELDLYGAGPFHPIYAHGVGAPPWQRFVRFGTEERELRRLHRVHDDRLRDYSFEVDAATHRSMRMRPGAVMDIQHRRFGLGAGRRVQILSAPRPLLNARVRIKVRG